MSDLRTINKIVTGMHTQDGAGVKLVRVIGRNDTADFDPLASFATTTLLRKVLIPPSLLMERVFI